MTYTNLLKIKDDTMEMLKKYAEPFESPDELLRRILSDYANVDDNIIKKEDEEDE